MSAAVIFDMDGLLLDSEDFWQQAEFEMFSSLGVPLQPEDTAQTLGWRCDYVVQHWYSKFAWQGPTPAEVGDAIIDKVIQLIIQQGKLMPGALNALQLSQSLNLPTALATSSNHRMMLATLKHFDLLHYFQATCSAEFLPLAKPHPQVYLNAAAALGIEPQQCVALEDSITGVIAAKAARMRCIAVPEHANFDDACYGIADLKLSSLLQLTAAELLR
jgi:HAD superfamily hydrolase (TIGR01509 family)